MKACSYSTRYKGRSEPRCGGKVLAPCQTCMGKYYPKGTRVRLGGRWKTWKGDNNFPVGKEGTVLGLSRTEGCIRLVFDGQKTPQTWHYTFLERQHGTKPKRKE